jgi:hypothetical protein
MARPRYTQEALSVRVSAGQRPIEKRPPEPCAQVRILLGAGRTVNPNTITINLQPPGWSVTCANVQGFRILRPLAPQITAPSTQTCRPAPPADNGPRAVALTPGRCPGTNTTGLTRLFSPSTTALPFPGHGGANARPPSRRRPGDRSSDDKRSATGVTRSPVIDSAGPPRRGHGQPPSPRMHARTIGSFGAPLLILAGASRRAQNRYAAAPEHDQSRSIRTVQVPLLCVSGDVAYCRLASETLCYPNAPLPVGCRLTSRKPFVK